MTVATAFPGFIPVPSLFDRALGQDAIQVRQIEAAPGADETSISLGLARYVVLERLVDAFIESAKPGWDGYAARAANADALTYALQFLSQVPADYPPPDVGLDSDGDFAIDWDFGPRRTFSVRIGRDGTLNYAGLVGHSVFHGVEQLREAIPIDVARAIGRVLGIARG